MKITSVIIAAFITFFSPVLMNAQTRHEVQAGETLYGISHKYNVTITDIQNANPGLGENLMTGQIILIPGLNSGTTVPVTAVPQQQATATPQTNAGVSQVVLPVSANAATQAAVATDGALLDANGNPIPRCKEIYIVKKKDTLYGIARDHGLTYAALMEANPQIDPEKKLKKNTEICIPYTYEEIRAMLPPAPVEEVKVYTPVSVGIIMPYGLSEEKKTKDMITMIDFYEGAMLAIKDLKADGVSVNVFAYDEADIDSVLALPQMKTLQLIIGAKDTNNISKLIRYTRQNGMKLVVPLSSNASLVSSNPHVYQVNCKMESDDYSNAFQSFAEMNSNAHFVFITIEDQLDKSDHVARLKNYLTGHNMAFDNIDLKSISTITDVLAAGQNNVIVLSSSTKTAFERVARKLADLELNSYRISMLGYNDWQTFADKESDAFRKLRCSFFTTFYMNPNATSTRTFNQKFRSSFQREQFNSYPRYGMLGYDITNFFVRHLYWEGDDFNTNIENLRTTAYQNPMHFKRSNSFSGYVNKAMMFVQYNADGTISVKQY